MNYLVLIVPIKFHEIDLYWGVVQMESYLEIIAQHFLSTSHIPEVKNKELKRWAGEVEK